MELMKNIVYIVEHSQFLSRNFDINLLNAKKLAESNSCDYIVFVESSSMMTASKKLQYLQLAYPSETSYVTTDNSSVQIKALENADYNLISAMTIFENSDKVVYYAEQGNFSRFKKYIPIMREIDGKRMMNEVRQYYGLSPITEHLKLNNDDLREKYFNKEIFNIGDIVESNNQPFEIVDRGTNYLVLVDSNGNTSRKWIQDVIMSEQTLFTDAQFQDKPLSNELEVSFKGYTTKNLHNAKGAAQAFQMTINNVGDTDPVSVLNALKYTDKYLEMTPAMILKGGKENESDLLNWSNAHLKAKQALDKHNEFGYHADYWHTYKDQLDKAVYAVRIQSSDTVLDSDGIQESVMDKNKDKLKVAKVISSLLGGDSEQCNCPDTLVNNALHKAKSLPKDSLKIVNKMLKLADEVGINYDKNIIKATNKLTTEQVELAMERAEKYGRKYPNPIDDSWILSEGKATITNKTKVTKDAVSKASDEEELVKMNQKGINVPVDDLDSKYKKDIENYANTGHVNGDTTPPGKNQPEFTHVGASLTSDNDDTLARMKAKKLMGESHEEDESDEEIDKMIDCLSDDDYLHAYEPEELFVIDSETGEEHKEHAVNEEALNEVLSRMERIKAKLRFAKTKAKREHALMLALKRHSDSKKINKRARTLAIHILKKKLMRGQDPAHVSLSDKERIERIVEKKKKVIDRMAMKLTSRIRKIEQTRLSHKNFTKD